MSVQRKIPVYIVSGCLGSGKTTLLSRLLSHDEWRDSAVIINEYGRIPLDHHLLRHVNEQTTVLGGGCICCTVRDDLVRELKTLLNDSNASFSRVVIETTGLADPAPIMFTILTDPLLQNHFDVASVIVTVDAANANMHLRNQPEALKQVLVADCVVITKADLVSAENLSTLQMNLTRMNPTAQVVSALFGELPANELFDIQDRSHATFCGTQGDTFEADLAQSQICSLSVEFEEQLDWVAFGIWLSMLLHARGEDVLRVKGLLEVGEAGPVVLNGVQHIIHPPVHLREWPDGVTRSQLVMILRSIEPGKIIESLHEFEQFTGASPKFVRVEAVS